MPTKATPMALQRRTPTRSPSSGTESAVTSSGVTARIAWALASGTRVMVRMKRPISTTSRSERAPCSQKCRVRSAALPPRRMREPGGDRQQRGKAQPEDLDDRIALGELLAAGVHAGEQQPGDEDAGDAATGRGARLAARGSGRSRTASSWAPMRTEELPPGHPGPVRERLVSLSAARRHQRAGRIRPARKPIAAAVTKR